VGPFSACVSCLRHLSAHPERDSLSERPPRRGRRRSVERELAEVADEVFSTVRRAARVPAKSKKH
jgi:hypothetical protein